MVSAEAIPFAKTGGLADVCGSLPAQLTHLGHRCSVFMPAYSRVFECGYNIVDTHVGFIVEINGKMMAARILKTTIPNVGVDFYFIDQPHYFGRSNLYGDQHGDYGDNCERFAFFCRSVVQALDRLRIPVDIVHCHDWQAGLVPAYIATDFHHHPWYKRAGSVMTIHNLAYQGRFPAHDMPITGLDWKYFNMHQMEFYNDVCFLKTGITFADWVTTVSPNYAREIQREDGGCGLDGVLRDLGGRLTGIVNGVDYTMWNPHLDNHLPQPYSVDNWKSGKSATKSLLQKELGLKEDPDALLVGMVGRLASQKGWDLVVPLIEHYSNDHSVQWAILGSGDVSYQNALQQLAQKRPEHVGVRFEFSDRIAHIIEAGADVFLMPSQYEPCGLNQLYSLKYGTVPVVHAVGGLVDTVVHTSQATIEKKTATGFAFYNYDGQSLLQSLQQAIDLFHREPNTWKEIVERGMQQDWSWSQSAKRYEEVYQTVSQSKRARM